MVRPAPAASTQPNTFLICVAAGDVPETMAEGDWLVSTARIGCYHLPVGSTVRRLEQCREQAHFDATYAPIDHTHDIDDVDGLQDALDASPSGSHTSLMTS